MLVPLDDAPDVVAVIPTLATNVASLATCVHAVAAQATDCRVAVVCVVNAPEAPALPGLPAETDIVTAGLNLGFAGALRFGRTLASAPLLWLVQDDIVAAPDCLTELAAALERDPATALVSPVAEVAPGVIRQYSCGGYFNTDGVMEWWYPSEHTAVAELDRLDELTFVASRGSLVRTSVWDEIGGMDPRFYPVMWADIDFCHALRQAGHRFTMVTSARIAGSTRGSTSDDYAMFLAGRNAELFIAKWHEPPHAPAHPPAPPQRPSAPGALTGVVDPRIPPDVLAAVAQASADTLLHLARNYSAPSPPPPPPPSVIRRVARRVRRVLRELRQ